MTAVLEARNLAKTYDTGGANVLALRGVDITVERGEFVAITGPSGCGKSTLLNLLAGLDRPTAGEAWLDGERIDELSETELARLRRGKVGFVSQSSSGSRSPERSRTCRRRPRRRAHWQPRHGLLSRGARALLRDARERGQTLVLVTHDARVAAAADRVIKLRDGLVADETELSTARGVPPLIELDRA